MKNNLIVLLLLFALNTTNAQSYYSENITATKLFAGAYGTVKLTIDDANNDGVKKPLIVAEGFDAGIILAPESANGLNTYSRFRDNIIYSGSNELNSLLTYSSREYDIIYVDWDNGVDYLQKNAYALEEVILWVNAQKAAAHSTEKNVVLGQSMGGVIARYALADMEQNGVDHQTRLFISHDAPQQGANIPVGVQYAFRHITNLYNQFSMPLGIQAIKAPLLENSILDQPATKQMLMNWSNANYTIDNSSSSSFYSELRSKGLPNSGGYPLHCRNIALSNGAECGTTQGFTAGDDLFKYTLGGGLPLWANLLTPFVAYFGWTAYGNSDLLGVSIVSSLPGSSSYDVNLNAKSIPYGSGNPIYSGRISYTKVLFSLLGWAPRITVDLTNVEKIQPAGVLPIDHYSGGYYDTSIVTSGISLPPEVYVGDRFNFIPTPSALDIGSGTITLQDSDYKRAYVGATPPLQPKNSPFANFCTDFEKYNPNASNKAHISFNSRNGEWLARELNANAITTNCSFMCSDAQISGPPNLCTSASYTAPMGGLYHNWTISQGANLVTLTGDGTPNITLTALPNATGAVQLILSFGDNYIKCGNRYIIKTIWVGKPQFNQFTFGSGGRSLCIAPVDCLYSGLPSTEVYAYFDGMSTAETNSNTNWEWVRENNLIFLNGVRNKKDICPLFVGNSSFKVRAKNACGWSEWIDYPSFEITECPNNFKLSSSIYKVFPNPSKDFVTIDLKNQYHLPEKNAIISGELYDMLGISRSKVKIEDNYASFSVIGLLKGIYVLKIYINGQVESHQIAVE